MPIPIPFFAWLLLALGFVSYARTLGRPGHCPNCGYDLRGTPERGPECGLEIGVTPTKP